VGVARNGGLPGGVEPVSEVALAEAELASTGPEDERLRSLGYIDAEDGVASADRAPAPAPRFDETSRALRTLEASSVREAPADAEATEPQRQQLADRSLRRATPPPASVAPREADRSVPAQAQLRSETSKAEESPVSSETSFDLDRVDENELADEPQVAEAIVVTSETPVITVFESPAPRARQVSAEGVPGESTPGSRAPSAKRAPSTPPAAQYRASLDASRAFTERVPGLESIEILREAGRFVLRARLEPKFGLEIEVEEDVWRELPLSEERLVRYELDEGLLGELRPGRELRLRTMPDEARGFGATFRATIPSP
ncbi:MAG: hypothetical protein AAGK22_12975, partial [Acidobacteriota bacterium]